MKFEILDHPAELRLRIYGKTKEELFINAAEAMAQVLKRGSTSQILKNIREEAEPHKIETIKISSIDINALLVDFLNEILARSQINKCVYSVSKINITSSQDLKPCEDKKLEREVTLKVEIIGYPIENFDEDIKAVTYQDVDIRQINPPAGGWQTNLVFDI